MNVLIVAKTKIGSQVCVGGLAASDRSVRLLEANGEFPAPSIYDVGQVWEMQFADALGATPPHMEDICVQKRSFVGNQPGLASYLRSRITPWTGAVTALFEGQLQFTVKLRGYIDGAHIPSRSTWFWLPDKDLQVIYNLMKGQQKPYYSYDGFELSYVGVAPPLPIIPANTLVRVSLARWWRIDPADPNCTERCFLQLSGWYI